MSELYLYQTLHRQAGRTMRLARHAALLDEASRELFGRPYNPDLRELERRVAALAASERYPTEVSGFIRLELLPDGSDRLRPAGVSLYDGYAMRCLTPEAITLNYDLPLTEAPTSAREAVAQWARHTASQADATVAVRCSSEGIALTADDAPLFAIRRHTVYTSPTRPSVERELACEAILAAGLALDETPIPQTELPSFDELFYADHRGITALSRCDGNPYMSIYAERIAAAMARIEQ